MRVFNSDEWSAAKGTVSVDLTLKDQVEIRVSCTHLVQVRGVREAEIDGKEVSVPLYTGTQFRLRDRFAGFRRLDITGEVEFGLLVKTYEYQDGEPIDHLDPPSPPMPGADNLVAQFQRMLRDNARRNSMPFMEPEDLPLHSRYEVEDDDFRFEEEISAEYQAAERKRKADAKKAAAEAKRSSSQPADGPSERPAADAGAREPSEPSTPPAKPPSSGSKGSPKGDLAAE